MKYYLFSLLFCFTISMQLLIFYKKDESALLLYSTLYTKTLQVNYCKFFIETLIRKCDRLYFMPKAVVG